MKTHYIVVEIEKAGKYTAAAVPVTGSDNILHKINVPGVISATLYETRTAANARLIELAELYKRNNTFMYS